jgi:hypothetical protein
MDNLAKNLSYDGDKISQAFFDALHDANFHYEAILLEKIWHAMADTPYFDSNDKHKLKAAAIRALNNMEL